MSEIQEPDGSFDVEPAEAAKELDPLSGEALRNKLRDILAAPDQDTDTTMRAIVTAVTKLGVDIGTRRSELPYPLSRGDRVDRMKVLLTSLPEDELFEIKKWIAKQEVLSIPPPIPSPLPS